MKFNFSSAASRMVVCVAIVSFTSSLSARPVKHTFKSGEAPLAILRQANTKSNVEFSYTNRGVLFNAGGGVNEGLFWPRGSGDSYIFGAGLWFAAKEALPASVQLEGWNFAGSTSGPLITTLVASSTSRRIFVANGSGSLYVRQDTALGLRKVTLFSNGSSDTAITALVDVHGMLLIGTTYGLFEGDETGPWLPTSVRARVSAISSTGLVVAGENIYFRNASGAWVHHPTPVFFSYLSASAHGAVILGGTIGGMLLRSKDSGNTWDTIFQTGILGAAVASDGWMVIGTAAGIAQSGNGTNWVSVNGGLPVSSTTFLQSADGIHFVLVNAAGVFTNAFANGTLGEWKQIASGVPWQNSVVAVAIDSIGFVHVADLDGDIYTQWKSKTFDPLLTRKLCDIGYNPNNGTGNFIEGETSQYGHDPGTDGAGADAKYISYVSPRYDPLTGIFIPGSSDVVPAPYYNWPVWDTSNSSSFLRNYYFGDYISDVTMRNATALIAAGSKPTPKPAMVSEEDIVNLYSDADTTQDSAFVSGQGYPLGIDVQEAIYSWSYGRYRDMIFVRYKVKNASTEPLFNCWIAPALDPDLDASVGSAANDGNSYVNGTMGGSIADPTSLSELREPYRSDPSKLEMAVQWRNYNQPPNGKQYGWLGISMVESPVVDAFGNVIPNDDSAALHGYGPNSLFQNNQLGLVTMRDWVIQNDPQTDDLRYDFVASASHDTFNGAYGDQRMLIATGPFNLLPGKSAEATIVLTFAHVSDYNYKQNFGALLLLTDFAHQVFGEIDSSTSGGTKNYFVNNFQVTPPSSVSAARAMNGLAIWEPFPNPFRTECTLTFSNATAGLISVAVCDAVGRRVQSFASREMAAGEHPITIDGTNLPAGMYRVTVTEGDETRSVNILHLP